MKRIYIFIAILCFSFISNAFGEDTITTDGRFENLNDRTAEHIEVLEATAAETTFMNYNSPRSYEIGGITVMGATSLDPRSIMMLAGLEMGERIQIPGDKIGTAIDRLWRQGTFGNVEIYATHIQENKIFLVIEMEELPRINQFEITGLRKFNANKLRDELEVKSNEVITENRLNRLTRQGINYFKEKGFLNANITAIQKFDTATGGINLTFEVNRGPRVKISTIEITGNEALRFDDPNENFRVFKKVWRWTTMSSDLAFPDAKVRRNLKNTKQQNVFRFWKRSKYVEPDFRDDIKTLTTAYGGKGFRDFRVVHDSLTVINNKRVKLSIQLSEGNTYYFGDIDFIGNTKYPNELLKFILDIKKGDVYDEEKLQRNLQFNPQQGDIYSLYTDDGYLSFTAVPVEVRVENDTVDLQIRIREGKQARLNRIGVEGNTRTNDYIIIRELRTYPGALFSRSELINSMNQLRMMRYFDDASINPDVRPNPDEGTADVIFSVEEVGSDQVELSGGWGGGMIVGTLGFSFNNFSIQNLFRKERWKPLPSGDGQTLTIRGQSNGSAYHSVSMSYTEPWLGGRRPYAFSVSGFTTMQSNGLNRGNEQRGEILINGGSLGLGQRLRVPDPWFTLYQSIGYQHYRIQNFRGYFPVDDGRYNNLNYTISLSRQNLDGAMFPKIGSEMSITLQATPPYSALNGKNYTPDMADQEQFRWLEFYKWNFRASWFLNPIANLVIHPRVRFGAIGRYNNNVGYTPFERFKLGGDGMSAYSYSGAESIGMRGYTNESLSPGTGAMAFNKLTFEVRYPITTNPAATIYGLVFVEAGNSWENPKQINPFQNYRSAGFGVRLWLAAMGMFGLDWGYGFDQPYVNGVRLGGSQFHFSINQSID